MINAFIQSMGLNALDVQTVKMMNPLKLAYLGDAVYEVYIRAYLVNEVVLTPHEMTKRAVKYVKAYYQSKFINGIKGFLTEDEWTLVKRGRNQKSNTVPKNASITDYRYATGLETLIGYLFLVGETDRLNEIVKQGILYLEGSIDTMESVEAIIDEND